MWHHYRHSKEDNLEAQAYFRHALTIDAQYPQADAALAIAVLNAGYLGWADDAERNYAEAFELAQRAVISIRATRTPASHSRCFACGPPFRSSGSGIRRSDQAQPELCRCACRPRAMLTFIAAGPKRRSPASKRNPPQPERPAAVYLAVGFAAAHYQLASLLPGGRDRTAVLDTQQLATNGLTYVVAGLAQLGRIEEARAALAGLKELDPEH